jgi:hypothetical protein
VPILAALLASGIASKVMLMITAISDGFKFFISHLFNKLEVLFGGWTKKLSLISILRRKT